MKVKNESGGALNIKTAGGPIKVATGKEVEVNEKQATSTEFAAAVQDGRLSLVIPASPTPEEIQLARRVLPPMLKSTGVRVSTTRSRFTSTQKSLLQMRTAFNTSWKAADAQLKSAKGAGAGWPSVKQGLEKYLFDTAAAFLKAKEDAVKAAQDAITALQGEDLAVTGRTREEWFAERKAKELELAALQTELAALKSQKPDPLIAESKTVDAAVTAVTALTAAKAIGTEIPEFGK